MLSRDFDRNPKRKMNHPWLTKEFEEIIKSKTNAHKVAIASARPDD